MNKTAIVTISYGTNYGNRLQNYALQELLNENGYSCETLLFKDIQRFTVFQKGVRFLKDIVFSFVLVKHENRIRHKRFRAFNKKYIHYGKYYLGRNIAPDGIGQYYDYFIIGSDQVWNARFTGMNINNFLASFAPPEKRIAYAASFGTSEIEPRYTKAFQRELLKFKAISVREQEGVRLVEQCGAKAVLVLDPTMMLTRQQWDKMAKKPRLVTGRPFIVTYFLGGRDENMNHYIQSVANGREIVHLDAELSPREKIENLAAYTTTPDEFVWLFAHADCVLTDSFHGTVFSILYHRPFMVFDRLVNGKKSGMESRIDTLLCTFHLEQCRGNIVNPRGEPVGGNWDEVEKILPAERDKSLDFLKKALDLA